MVTKLKVYNGKIKIICCCSQSSTANFECVENNIQQHINPFQPSAEFHIETSQLIYTAKQMTSF